MTLPSQSIFSPNVHLDSQWEVWHWLGTEKFCLRAGVGSSGSQSEFG